jgi:hypothetical protein
MLETLVAFAAFGIGCLYIAHEHPQRYLRLHDTIGWSIHAVSLGLLFGMGVIVGRYGFSAEAGGVIVHWLIVYAPIVTCAYVFGLLYHGALCTLAEKRQQIRQVAPTLIRNPGR